MTYLPDTNCCVAYLRNKNTMVRNKFLTVPAGEIILCDVVRAELWYGAHRSNNFAANKVIVETFRAPFGSQSFETRAAEIYGRIKRELEVVGTPIGPNDLLIAAIALASNFTLVTHNTREFQRVNGLLIADWEV